VEKYPYLANLILARGHEIGDHTYMHPNLTRLSNEKVLAELDATKRIVRDKTGKEIYLFRPPGGRVNRRVLKAAQEDGYRQVLWTVLPKDHEESVTKDAIVRRVVGETNNYGIICLHQGVQKTIDAMDEVIDRLRAKGFRFVTVSQLLGEKERIELAKVDLRAKR